MDEEIKLRAGLDTTDFDRNKSRMDNAVHGTGDIAHKSFLHASNGAREFHKSLHLVTEQSGIAGTVLKLALSPISGLLTAVTVGAGYVAEKIKEINAQSDALEKGTSNPVFKLRDAIDAAKKSLFEFNLEFDKWMMGKEPNLQDRKMQALRDQLGILEKQVTAAEKLAKGDDASVAKLDKKKLQLQQALQSQALFGLAGDIGSQSRNVEHLKYVNQRMLEDPTIAKAQANVAGDLETKSKLEQVRDQIGKEGWRDKLIDALRIAQPLLPIDTISEMVKGPEEKQRELLNQQIKAAESRIRENNKAIEHETELRKVYAMELDQAKSKLDNSQKHFDQLSISLDETNQALKVMNQGSPDLRNPMQKAVDDWLTDRQAAMSNWNTTQGKKNMAFLDALTPFKNATTHPTTVAGTLKSMDEQLQQLNKTMTSGIPVFGKD